MSYSLDNRFSYKEYLTAQKFVEDIKSTTINTGQSITMDISNQTLKLLASNESLKRENIRVIEKQGDSLKRSLDKGFSRISYDIMCGIEQISNNISELNSTFHWGFSQILSRINRMNDSLEMLVNIAKTPTQTVAYEQYEMARDAFRKGLYKESLEFLDRAINGDHTSTGYKLEWRFHQMMGTILLGFVGCDFELMDLSRAEDSFLLAARYSKSDFPDHSAKAFFSAGWAAYCQGKIKEALVHTNQAIKIMPNFAEAFFQAAKIQIALDEVDASFISLSKAIDHDVFYALKAAGDKDFQRYDDTLREFLTSIRKKKYQELLVDAQNKISKVISWREYKESKDAISSQEMIESFIKSGKNWKLIELRDIINLIRSLKFVKIQRSDKTIEREVIVKPAGFFRKAITERIKETIPGEIFWIKKVDIQINNDKSPQVGSYYMGTVKRITDYGAFIEILPKIEGLLHISQIDTIRIKKVSAVLKVKDNFIVKCLEIYRDGMPRLSRKEVCDSFLYGGRVIQNEE